MSQFPKNTPVFEFPIDAEIEEFLIDREARNLTPKTLLWYFHSLNIFKTFITEQQITTTNGIAAGHI